MTWFLPWLVVGFISSGLAYAAFRLSFRDRPNLGTVVGFILGALVPPVAVLVAITWLCCWAFGEPQQRYVDVKWPLWWGRLRYKQHRALRWLWYFGSPPKEESVLSGWRDAPKNYLN